MFLFFPIFFQIFPCPLSGNDAKKTSVVLLGLPGCGKTSALNLILERAGGHYSFSEARPEAPKPTLACDRKKVFAEGRQLVLVDTPEMWDEDGMEKPELVKDCLALSLPGPRVFLLVLLVGRFTQGECNMLGHLQKVFGRDFVEHAIILFVRFDGGGQRPQRISDFMAGGRPEEREPLLRAERHQVPERSELPAGERAAVWNQQTGGFVRGSSLQHQEVLCSGAAGTQETD